MSDLSVPPLSLIAAEGAARSEQQQQQLMAPPTRPPEVFVWPTPALACYPAPRRPAQPEACEVEGLNGKTIVGRLMHFSPTEELVKLRAAPSSTTMTLRFDQFRRLRLLQPLATLPAPPDLTQAELLAQRPALPFVLQSPQQQHPAVEGLTIGYAETDFGVFIFEPLDLSGTVRRSFLPRALYPAFSVGPRIGEALVEQSLATPAQVQEALTEQQQLRSQKLGDMLVVRQIITHDELAGAIEAQAKMPMVRIGEALTALGFISDQQLDEALQQQKADRSVALGELLVRKGMVSRQDLQTALARKMGYPLVDAIHFPVDALAVQRLSYAIASRLPALPLMLHGGRLVVALEDPSQRLSVDEIEFASQCKVVPVLARTGVLQGAVDKAYEKVGGIDFASGRAGGTTPIEFEAEDAGKLLATLETQQTNDTRVVENEDVGIEQSDNSLVRLINSMILEAQSQGVSDIHVETQPGREKLKIRFRKDGHLKPYLELPHTYRNALIARLKIMSDLDISEKRKPQDGKINFGRYAQGHKLELRVATIPTSNGLEDAVLRLLASAKPLPLDKLNLSPTNLERLKVAIQRPYGMVLCVGPTGSGKTTTLHSALGFINKPDRKIWTAEDPIEITQAGLRQVQVNPKIDWTFAKALRAFLRADPDVVMVGEIRDKETSQMAIEASLTGHLVLSTLHTNSAPETVTRLLDMGMDPFNFGDALLAVLAQRLVRRLCTDCRTPHEATDDEVADLLRDHRHAMGGAADAPGMPDDGAVLAGWLQRFGGAEGRLTLYRQVGCPKCDNSGYRGRCGIHELMTVSRGVRQMIQSGARAELLQTQALTEGMRTLRQDGLEKVLAGATTLEEVRAVSN